MLGKIRLATSLAALALTALLVVQCAPSPLYDGPSTLAENSAPSAFTSPLALMPIPQTGMGMMAYPASLDALLNEAALVVIGEVGSVYRHLDHVVYGDDGSLLMEGDEKQRAYAERIGLPATDLYFKVHEVLRDDGTIARGAPIFLRVPGTISALPPGEGAFSNVPQPDPGKFLYLLTPEPDGSAFAITYGPYGKFAVDGDTLRIPSTGELFQFRDGESITLSVLLEVAASDSGKYVPRVWIPDPSVTPAWLIETDPIELFKDQIVSEYLSSGASDEERAWREEWVACGGEQILRESYDLTVYIQQTEPNFRFSVLETSFADNVPYRVEHHIRNMSADDYTEKYLKDFPWADLITVVEIVE